MVIGYTQGTYDLFHKGHLNLLKNAKRHCDYLIVGINSDSLVRRYKGRSPIIPEQDRMDIVEAIKVVDKVVLCETLEKMPSWNKFHFKYVFIGSDWENSERWKKTEEEFSKLNVEVIYLPHTPNISSSYIREKIK